MDEEQTHLEEYLILLAHENERHKKNERRVGHSVEYEQQCTQNAALWHSRVYKEFCESCIHSDGHLLALIVDNLLPNNMEEMAWCNCMYQRKMHLLLTVNTGR